MSIEPAIPSTRISLPGAVHPDHPEYDAHRQSFNGLLDRRPAVIVPCATTEEVVAAVLTGRAAGLPLAVRGGGHNVAGHAFQDGALIVSLTPMRTVTVDPERRLAHAGGGALWNDVDAPAFDHGLGVTGGTFGDTGIGGLTLGGGIGWLMPIMGLTCDNLVEAEVVTADGSVVIAGPSGDPELLWALRGGGGNFGIVTRFTYRLIPIGPMYGGTISWPASAAAGALARITEVLERWPTSCAPFVTVGRGEDGQNEIAVLVAVVDGTDGETIAATLRRDLPVKSDDLGPRTYLELQAQSGVLPFGLRHYWKGHFIRELDPPLFESLLEAAASEDAVESCFVLIEAITGAGHHEPAGGAAFGQRTAGWNASAIAIWENPDVDAIAVGWARRVVDLLAPASMTGGGYMNYSPVDETPDRVRAAYGPERWERLVAVKRRYDPENVFRFNHNIRPD